MHLSPPAGDSDNALSLTVACHEPELKWTYLEATIRWITHESAADMKQGFQTWELLHLCHIVAESAKVQPWSAI
jgi:hypothetical protein